MGCLQFLNGRITLDPNIANGRPTIRGLRMTVHTVLDYLAAGDTAEDILQDYPFLQPEDIQACLQYDCMTYPVCY